MRFCKTSGSPLQVSSRKTLASSPRPLGGRPRAAQSTSRSAWRRNGARAVAESSGPGDGCSRPRPLTRAEEPQEEQRGASSSPAADHGTPGHRQAYTTAGRAGGSGPFAAAASPAPPPPARRLLASPPAPPPAVFRGRGPKSGRRWGKSSESALGCVASSGVAHKESPGSQSQAGTQEHVQSAWGEPGSPLAPGFSLPMQWLAMASALERLVAQRGARPFPAGLDTPPPPAVRAQTGRSPPSKSAARPT